MPAAREDRRPAQLNSESSLVFRRLRKRDGETVGAHCLAGAALGYAERETSLELSLVPGEAEARRQSLECAATARDPNSDEAQVMREMEAHFEEVMREWK